MKNKLIKKIRELPVLGELLVIIKYKIWLPLIKHRVGLFIKIADGLSRVNIYVNNDKKIRELRNSYIGEKCIIVGNGPSLSIDDLEMIKNNNIKSFGLNRIYELYDKTSWRPDFVCVQDIRFINGRQAKIDGDEFIKKCCNESLKKIFVISDIKRYIRKSENRKNEKVCYFRMKLAGLWETQLEPYSEIIYNHISDLGTVTAAAIQIATYLGFKEIYLYGQDYSYSSYLDRDGNFIDDEDTINYSKQMENITYKSGKKGSFSEKVGYNDLRKMMIGFEMCQKYAEDNHVSIINITRGGMLNVFKRSRLEDIV